VTNHEYGHYFMDNQNIENNPGGSHSSSENLSETRGKDVGTRLAWGEGFPTYFGTVLQQKMGTAAFGIPNVGDTTYTDTEDSTLTYSIEAIGGSGIGLGEDNEATVTRSLWDLYDSAADAGDMRGVALGDVAIFNALKPAGPTTLSAAYAALTGGASAQTLADYGCIFTQQGAAPRITAPADGSVAVASQPPTITWAAQGGGPTFRNNAFIVRFYNANFGTLLFDSAEQAGTSFTPSGPQWSTIVSGAGGGVVRVVIRGRQTAAPATGPYTSCDIGIDSKASPTITTEASPGNLLGAPVRDVATLASGFNPTGNVTFRLFSDNTCMTQVFTSTDGLVGVTATSPWFTPTAAATYYWTAVYGGDTNNHTATSACLAANESVVIAPFVAPPYTRTINGDLYGPVTVAAGESVLVQNARVYGPVTVNAGGAFTLINAKVSGGIVANAPLFFSLCGGDIGGAPSSTQAVSVTNAMVPIRLGDPAAGCAGNRLAGTVNVASNLAVMFGANMASGTVAITTTGPGNSIVKANTFYATLSCSGNTPAPVNAGQANSGPGAKTGQCAAL
jgi:hypothetical protein